MGSKGIRAAADNGEGEEMKNRISYIVYRISRQAGIKRIILLVFGLWSLVFFVTGCGYTTRSMISDKYKSIYITPFLNKVDITRELDSGNKYKIYRPRLETDVTVAVTNRFLFDGNLRPLRKDSADLTLKGEVIEYRKDPLEYADNDEVSKYRMNLVVNVSLWDNKENKLVWEASGFTGYFEYFTNEYPLTSVTRYSSDDTPLTKALDDLARRIVERTVNEW